MSSLHDAFTPDERALQRALVDAASQRFRAGGRFAWHFARGKLGGDPMFLASNNITICAIFGSSSHNCMILLTKIKRKNLDRRAHV